MRGRRFRKKTPPRGRSGLTDYLHPPQPIPPQPPFEPQPQSVPWKRQMTARISTIHTRQLFPLSNISVSSFPRDHFIICAAPPEVRNPEPAAIGGGSGQNE